MAAIDERREAIGIYIVVFVIYTSFLTAKDFMTAFYLCVLECKTEGLRGPFWQNARGVVNIAWNSLGAF